MPAENADHSDKRSGLIAVSLGVAVIVCTWILQVCVGHVLYGDPGLQYRSWGPIDPLARISYASAKMPVPHLVLIAIWIWMWKTAKVYSAIVWGTYALALALGLLVGAAALTAVHP